MNLNKRYIIPVMLSEAYRQQFAADVRPDLRDGDWFEACHVFKSEGTYRGDFEITEDDLHDFVNNFRNAVNRRYINAEGKQELHIDFDHYMDGAKGYEACGWIVDVKVENKVLPNGSTRATLYMKPKWTMRAQQLIADGAYRYFSIEFDRDYYDDQSGKTARNVLAGGALTNDPFVTEMEPIALSALIELRKAEKLKAEEAAQNKQMLKEAESMKKILVLLSAAGKKLSDNAGENEIETAVKEIIEESKSNAVDAEEAKAALTKAEEAKKEAEDKLSAIEAEKKAEAEKAAEAKLSALKEQAVISGKFSAGELSDATHDLSIAFADKDIAKAELILKYAPVKFTAAQGSSAEGTAVADPKADLKEKILSIQKETGVKTYTEALEELTRREKKIKQEEK